MKERTSCSIVQPLQAIFLSYLKAMDQLNCLRVENIPNETSHLDAIQSNEQLKVCWKQICINMSH